MRPIGWAAQSKSQRKSASAVALVREAVQRQELDEKRVLREELYVQRRNERQACAGARIEGEEWFRGDRDPLGVARHGDKNHRLSKGFCHSKSQARDT